jgi:hypothetical protein
MGILGQLLEPTSLAASVRAMCLRCLYRVGTFLHAGGPRGRRHRLHPELYAYPIRSASFTPCEELIPYKSMTYEHP